MRGYHFSDEPECDGPWCIDWGLCQFSLELMWEDSSLRTDWIKELKGRGRSLPKGATAAWRKFLKSKRNRT